MEMSEQTYAPFEYKTPKPMYTKKCTYFMICIFFSLLLAIFLMTLSISISLIYAGEEVRKCHILMKTNDLIPLLNNIAQYMNDTEIDMSAFSLISRVVVKNRKQVEDLFPFINETKIFLRNSKKCIQKYDICPEI